MGGRRGLQAGNLADPLLKTRVDAAGEAFAESVDVMHNGVNNGIVPVKLVMFAAGAYGQPYAVKPPAPAEAKPAEK